jgi:hypothetical protein
MRRNVWMVATLACLATAGASAQSGSTAASKDAITVTGCLQPDTQSAANTATGPGFKLTSVMKSEAPSTAAGATGTSGTMPSSTAIASAYALDGSDAELKTHVGHKVEVTGTPAAAPRAGVTGDPAPPASAGRTADNGAPRLKVSSIRMIAADCSPK